MERAGKREVVNAVGGIVQRDLARHELVDEAPVHAAASAEGDVEVARHLWRSMGGCECSTNREGGRATWELPATLFTARV